MYIPNSPFEWFDETLKKQIQLINTFSFLVVVIAMHFRNMILVFLLRKMGISVKTWFWREKTLRHSNFSTIYIWSKRNATWNLFTSQNMFFRHITVPFLQEPLYTSRNSVFFVIRMKHSWLNLVSLFFFKEHIRSTCA